MSNLQPATSYHIHLAASNALGQGQPSVGLTVTTEEEAPEGPPLSVAATALTSRGFTLTWAPPSAQLQNGLVHTYLVTIDSGRTLNRTAVVASTAVTSTEYAASGLRPATNYVVGLYILERLLKRV